MTTCYHKEKRWAFVHIPKTAGTAVGGFYGPSEGKMVWKNSWLNEQVPGWSRDNLPNGHVPVHALPQFTGKPLDWWEKIIVSIRNPCEQQVSQWQFWRARCLQNIEMDCGSHPDDLFATCNTFEQFCLDDRSNGPNVCCGRKWRRAGGVYRWWCCDSDNKIPPNVRIIRVEDLPGAICDELGLPLTEIPERNSGGWGAQWRKHFTDACVRHTMAKYSWSLAVYYPDVLNELREMLDSSLQAEACR